MACQEPRAGELEAEGAKAEELSKEELPKEDPRQEEPPKEEPAEEEPAKEEPAKEEPVKEEPPKEEASKAEAAKDVARHGAATAEKPQEAALQAKKADGESSASQVVGGSWTRPKGPSPEDDVLLESWRNEGKLHVLEGVWCCVPYKVTVVVADGTESQAAKGKAQEILDGIAKEAESVFSHFVDSSEVSTINKLGKDELHSPSLAMRKVLTTVSTLNKMTRGLFDPAVLPLVRRFREGAEDIGEVAAYSKWSMFSLTDDGLKKAHADAQLDLCGLAKGWAIDEMASRLKEAGYMASYVDWGGDIKVTGQHPAGRNWNVAVREPPSIDNIGAAEGAGETQHIAHIELRDGQAIATSGDYLQTTATGLSHIVDPRKGAPVKISGDTCASASVVCSSCMLADALATAAMAAGAVKDSRQLLDNFRGAQLKDPVLDYFLYSRTGPRVVRLREFSAEVAEQREDRLTRHDEAVVVVIGGGLAGISAAIEASKARAKVILLEKESELGGNSAKATSGINACGTRVQRAAGVDDDGRFFERDTHVSAKGGQSQVGCVSVLSDKSADAIHWLIDELGVPLTALSQLGGHARKRTHRVPPRDDGTPVPVGYTIMQHARAAASGMDGIDVRTQCTVKHLLRDKDGVDEAIVGVEYVDKDGASQTLKCDAVVITTGGFGFDHSDGSYMQKYRPDLVGVPTTNGSFATGDGLKLGEELGAHMIDMDKVQLHPTAFIDPKDPGAHTKYLGPEALRGSGGILLDQQGRRFVNELDLRSVVSNKILQHCDPYKMPDGTEYRPWAWCVLNEEAQEKFGKPMLMFYKDQVGLFQAVQGTSGLAELIGCDEQNILDTLKDYAAAADQKICGKTGKVVFPSRMCTTDKSFIVGRITPCIHYTMGGLEIGPCGEVLTRRSGGAIGRRTKVPRLFAAGECTGGVHGGNRLGGNSLLECVVFGRMAGERAATIKQSKVELLSSGEWEPLVLLEVRDTCSKYGHNTAVYRFMLHGSLQHTGLEVGRFIAIRGEVDGDTMTGYYSPISRPEDTGIIDILCRVDEKGGPIVQFLQSLKPGASALMKGMGGLKIIRQPSVGWFYLDRQVRRLSLLCGGTGLAPAVQIARAFVHGVETGTLSTGAGESEQPGLKIVYAAESTLDLAFIMAFDMLKERYPGLISYYLVLNKPPPGWTQGVGFVDQDCIRQNLWFPPKDDHLLVMCGPPIFEKIMCGNLSKLGYPREQYYSFDADPNN